MKLQPPRGERNALLKFLKLREAVEAYLSEHDNPAPDYAHRHHLRERLRQAASEARDQ